MPGMTVWLSLYQYGVNSGLQLDCHRMEKAEDKVEGAEETARSEGMIHLQLRGFHQQTCGVLVCVAAVKPS